MTFQQLSSRNLMSEPFPSKKPDAQAPSPPSYNDAMKGQTSIDPSEKDMKTEKASKQSKISALKSLFTDKAEPSSRVDRTQEAPADETKAASDSRHRVEESLATKNRGQMRFGS